ncbi:hypothetical protein ACIBMZ_13645 [Micromonospora sp. NPDC049900]|uniref:hypothetical protein n=1 Tax=Micromonospora sp. NPDC049900 TaxID=3364275 RepID=UPI0037924CEE
MRPATYAYDYPISRDENGRERIGRNYLEAAPETLCTLSEVPWRRPAWAEDLLHIARAVYLADKLSLRDRADDRWTRQIDLRVQVTHADVWHGHALDLFSSLVGALTADRWRISVRPGAPPLPHQGRSHYDTSIEEVALFSGGLDSTAYAAERSLVSAGDLLLVSYFEPKWKSPQDAVFGAIDRSPRRGLSRFVSTQQVRAGRSRLEKSARTRGLLYAATAVFFAATHRVAQVAVPENGQLALNPALTPARVAACSTRSVHPFTLGLLNEVIRQVGGAVEVVNPYLHLTKGEVCRRASDAGLPPTTLTRHTVSCGRASSSHPELHLPAGIDLGPLVAVVDRGRSELSAMFDRHRETGR